MNTNYEVLESLDLLNEEYELNFDTEQKAALDVSFINCLNRFGMVDIKYIADKSGISVDKAIAGLKGAIYQDPAVFSEDSKYSNTVGWVTAERYLCGNIRKKIKLAIRMNKRFPGRFDSNVEILKSVLPPKVDAEEIYISPGASWMPLSIVSQFLKEFFRLGTAPEVIFYKDLLTYEVVETEDMKRSVLNTIKYGVQNTDYQGSYSAGYVKQYYTGIQLFKNYCLNGKTIKVNDYIPKRGYGKFEYEPIPNKSKTVEAQEKAEEILEAFNQFVVATSARKKQIESSYNEYLTGNAIPKFDGSFLEFSDLNPEVKLYKYQADAIARALLSETNTLFAHDVGTGKTYIMIGSVHELYRMGLSKKNLVVVPNNVLQATVDAHRYLYKDDNILVIHPDDFKPGSKNILLQKIRDNDYVAVYMAYSSFDQVVMSKQYYIDKMEAEINEYKRTYYNTDIKQERKAVEKQIRRLQRNLAKYICDEEESRLITFDKLGINTLVVDEAHNYKNIPIPTRTENIVGIGGVSKKCVEMLEKAHYVDRLIFATGTPLTNSLADLFAFQTYLQPDVLKYHKINTFDRWINTFGKRITAIECDVDANSKNLRTMTRFSSFHNLNELMNIFSQVCDFHIVKGPKEGIPRFDGYTDVLIPKSDSLDIYMKLLSERSENFKLRVVNRREDNLLKITTDGRMAALDLRLLNSGLPFDPFIMNKIRACAENAFEVYNDNSDCTQIVFCDLGTPKAGFNVYDELSRELQKLGMSEHEIAYVHDAKTEKARQKLFADMNNANVKIVIGSTQKLGVGVNVQERLKAIHHLSIPWRPADMVQREGRILRNGNTCDSVNIFRYITEGSFDAYSWQLLENKQRFISDFLSGTSSARDMEDIDDMVLSYAEVKALAIGNPLIKKRVEVANRLERSKINCRGRQKQLKQLEIVVATVPSHISKLQNLAAIADKDYELYSGVKASVPNDERIAFGEELLEALKENVMFECDRVFDKYQGFEIVLPKLMTEEHPFVIARSSNGGSYICDVDEDKTPLGCSKTIDYVLEHLGSRADKYRADIEIEENNLSEAKKDLSFENPYLEEIDRLKTELAVIDKLLEDGQKEEKSA